jgi:hypothetical protein
MNTLDNFAAFGLIEDWIAFTSHDGAGVQDLVARGVAWGAGGAVVSASRRLKMELLQ